MKNTGVLDMEVLDLEYTVCAIQQKKKDLEHLGSML